MAASNANKGHCYLCGQELAKASMQKHLTAKHASEENGQECFLLKVESEDADHWLFVDIAASSTLSALDRFLRKIWLECCGHLSMFYLPGRYGDRVGMSTKIDSLNVGFTLMYDYDFGSETTLKIKFIKKMFRPAQRSVVRCLQETIRMSMIAANAASTLSMSMPEHGRPNCTAKAAPKSSTGDTFFPL